MILSDIVPDHTRLCPVHLFCRLSCTSSDDVHPANHREEDESSHKYEQPNALLHSAPLVASDQEYEKLLPVDSSATGLCKIHKSIANEDNTLPGRNNS